VSNHSDHHSVSSRQLGWQQKMSDALRSPQSVLWTCGQASLVGGVSVKVDQHIKP